MRDFAKKRVFATSDRSGEIQQGLTYREWLIGMTLSGYAARPGKNGDGVEPVEIAKLAIQAADSAIEQMEVEQKLEDLGLSERELEQFIVLFAKQIFKGES